MTESDIIEPETGGFYGRRYRDYPLGEGSIRVSYIVSYTPTQKGESDKRSVRLSLPNGKELSVLSGNRIIVRSSRGVRGNLAERLEKEGIPKEIGEKVATFLRQKTEPEDLQLKLFPD